MRDISINQADKCRNVFTESPVLIRSGNGGAGLGTRHYAPTRAARQRSDAQKKERFRAPFRRTTTHQQLATALQYFGTFGSTRSDQAVIPPARLCTFAKPDCCRNATALALRPPILQWTTISRLESSSLTRLGRSFSGIKYPPMLQI